jgi:hypothetical protein
MPGGQVPVLAPRARIAASRHVREMTGPVPRSRRRPPAWPRWSLPRGRATGTRPTGTVAHDRSVRMVTPVTGATHDPVRALRNRPRAVGQAGVGPRSDSFPGSGTPGSSCHTLADSRRHRAFQCATDNPSLDPVRLPRALWCLDLEADEQIDCADRLVRGAVSLQPPPIGFAFE